MAHIYLYSYTETAGWLQVQASVAYIVRQRKVSIDQ